MKWVPSWSLISKTPEKPHLLETWGPSSFISKWAKSRNLVYDPPEEQTVQELHSKAFSHAHSPQLQSSILIREQTGAEQLLRKSSYPIVLKEAFGAAGRGIHVLESIQQGISLLKKRHLNYPIIIEPFVPRLLDFSSQWFITNNSVQLLGYCKLLNGKYGTYQGSLAGTKKQVFGPYEFAIEEHEKIAYPLLKKVQQMGFFGHLGIDAMVYQVDNRPQVVPVVEINTRKTMGLVALKLRELHYPNRAVQITFNKQKNGLSLLPEEVQIAKGKKVQFQRKLVLDPVL